MTAPVVLSVVIPARDAAEWIAAQLEAVLAQELDAPFEVVVADNGSADRTPDIVSRYAETDDRVRLVHATDTGGAGAARNAGAAAAHGRLLAFCDADDLVAPGWLAGFLAADDGDTLLVGALDETLGLAKPSRWQMGSRDRPPRTLGELFAPGGNCAVPRRVFELVGGFPEGHATGEDVTFSRQARALGVRLRFVPDAVVYVRARTGLRAWRAWQAKGYDSVVADRQRPPGGGDADTGGSADRAALLACLSQPWRNRRLWLTIVAYRLGRLRAQLALGRPR